MFKTAHFIKPNVPFVAEYRDFNLAPMFRKTFLIKEVKTAKLLLCALGYGYCWINGQKVSADVLASAASDYRKTLWVHEYDVSSLLKTGKNIVAVWCGNGMYNETHKSIWNQNQAEWRDNPKVILSLVIDGEEVLVSDESWKCCENTAITYNQLRSGEYFDSRLYDKNWNTLQFDDSSWNNAVIDKISPKGTFRIYPCEAVQEFEIYQTKEIIKTGEKRYVFDIGQNISGYIRLKVKQRSGDVITIRYGEALDENNALKFGDAVEEIFYPESPFQTDRFICNGEEFIWSPLFTYHGFRYIELTGAEEPTFDSVSGVFVHLDVNYTSEFESSNEYLNYLFQIGRMANLSNFHYIPTDCPTREKMGWANDMQASAEQMLMNFDITPYFKKWMVDVGDSMRDDGAIPGIIPTSGWGYDWVTGPVSSGVLFEIPFKVYLYTADSSLLQEYFPVFEKHLDYIISKADETGLISFEKSLWDWAGPLEDRKTILTPTKFIDTCLYIKFLKITLLAANLSNNKKANQLQRELEQIVPIFKNEFINSNGTCKINEQTAVAMLIYHDLYDCLEPLKQQLKQLVEEKDFHHHCGMVGLRHLYYALNRCGLPTYAYKIITAKGFPSYSQWVEGGATTLWELWDCSGSKNHHMYSDFMLWLMQTLVGINPILTAPGFKEVEISPVMIGELTYCRGHRDTPSGRIKVAWKKEKDIAKLKITIPPSVIGKWNGKSLSEGEYCFTGHRMPNGEYRW